MPKIVYRTGRRLLVGSLMVAAACRGDRPTLLEPPAPGLEPEFVISDGAHSGGTPGFFFLPPMVSQPGVTGILDDDITFVNPVVVICDVTDGPDVDCGASAAGATTPVRSFTVTTDPAITVDSDKYQVNWDTGEPGFAAGRIYRVHVLAGPSRRELGFADVFLTTQPGKVKNGAGDLIVLNDGRTLPIHFRIEQGVVPRPGPAQSFELTGLPASVLSGATASVTVTARDEHGNVASGYRGTVAFTSSDPNATLPPDYAFTEADAGIHTFADAISFKKAGTATVRVTDVAAASILGEAVITVLPLDAALLEMSGLSDPVEAGTVGSITVTARDVNGNVATGYTGTIAFTSSDPKATLPGNYTFTAADAGTHAFSAAVTLRTAGSVTVTPTDQAVNTITGAQTVTVTAAAAARLVPGGIPLETMAGVAYDLTVTAQDQFGNTAIGYGGTVQFSSSDAAATLPPAYAFQAGDAGVRSFPGGVTFKTAGARTLQASDGAVPAIAGNLATIVAPAAAAELRFTVQPSDALAGNAIAPPVVVTAYDPFGNLASTYAGQVTMGIGTNPAAGVLSGTVQVAAVSGAATFDNLRINAAGSGYRLVASATGLTAANSEPFDIIAPAPVEVHWTNPAGGNWSVASNWSTGTVPTADQTALIDLAGTYTVTLDMNATVNSLSLGAMSGLQSLNANGRTLTVMTSANVLSSGRMNLTSSTVNGSGTLAIASGGVLSLSVSNTINTAVVNAGTLALGITGFSSTSTINGAFTTVAGSLVRVQGTASNSSTLTVASGFTNHGTIELTKSGDIFGGAALGANGTLVNAPDGTISILLGTGGSRTLGAQLDNQGTLSLGAALTINRGSADHTNSGTIAVSGGNLTVSQTGTTPSFTNTGTITVAAGRTWAISGGSFTHAAGGTLDGGGAMSLSSVTSASFGTAFNLGALTLSSSTASFATDVTTETTALSLTNSTVNGAGTLTNAAGKTLSVISSIINTAFVNAGTFAAGVPPFSNTSSINGAFTTVAGSLVRVQAHVSNNSTLTVANGFTNHGTIELTKSGDAIGGSNLVVSSGTLINAADGVISSVAGSGGGRTLNAQLDNRGTVNVGHPIAISRGSAQHTNSGTIGVTGGNLTLSQSGTTPSFTNSGTVTVAAGRTLAITGGSFTQATGATLDGGGALSLSSVNPAVFETAAALGALTLSSATASFATDITTQTTVLTLTSSTVNGPGILTNAAGRVVSLSLGNTINTAVVNAGTLAVGVGGFSSTSTITGAFTTVAGSMVRVTSAGSSNSTLSVASGFTNHGTIELTKSEDTFGSSTLAVSSGTLVNAPDGTIRTVAGTGGTRTLNAQLENQGTVNVAYPLTINRGSAAHTNGGTIAVTAGDLTITQSGTTPSFTNSGTIDVATARALRIGVGAVVNEAGAFIQGAGTFEAGTSASFSNAGTVTVGLMRIGDGLTSTGTFAPVTAEFFASAATIPVGAGYSYTNVRVLGAATFAGSASMAGNLTVAGSGNLTIGAHEIAVAASFATQNTSLLTMQNAAGILTVSGNASFGGGSTNTRLTAGTLRVAGNFAQAGGSAAAFAASANHLTVLNGSGAQTVSFGNPGTTTTLSHFHRLEIANGSAAGVTLGNAVFANGQLRTPASPSVARTLSSAGHTVQVGGLDAIGLVFDGTPLRVVNGEALTRFDDAVFRNMDPIATQFRLDRLADVVTFNNIQFLTTPTTGVYLHLADTDLAAPLFTVTMQGTQPPNHGGKVIESVAGQLLGWPF